MATPLSVGDIATVQYNTSTDAFSFVFLRDVEAGTTVNFTDNGWLASGGFRSGEDTVTYTAATAIAAGTVITLTGLDLDEAGDQIIAYQGDPASPTILHLIDFGDGNNTVAGDATDANTTALPPGFTLGVNAVAVAFDQSLYAGPLSGSPAGLFAALNNSANWFEGDAPPVGFIANKKPTIDLDADNSTNNGNDYDTTVASGGPAVPVADIDIAIGDDDGFLIFAAEIKVNGTDPRDHLTVNGSLPAGIVATAYNPVTGILRLDGQASHAAYEAAIRQVEFSTTDNPNQLKRVNISVNDGVTWSKDASAFIHVSAALPAAPPVLDLDANNSSAEGADASATYTAGGPAIPVTDIDITITDADSTTIQSATITILGWARNLGDTLSVAGSLPGGITASSYDAGTGVLTLSGSASLADYQAALHQVVYSNTLSAPSIVDRGIEVAVNDGIVTSNAATMYMHVVVPPPNAAPVLDLDANNSTTPGANYLTGFTDGGSPVAIADADVSIFDSDGPSLASATVTLTNPQTDDVLTFEGTPPAGIVVSGSGTSVVTLTGTALSASYETALQQIKFSNSNIDPSNVTRVIQVVVNDGSSDSNTATAIIQVEAVNNSAPVVDLDPNESGGSIRGTFHTNFTENGTPIPIADTDTTITDLDSTTLVSATITLANQHPGDLLSVGPSLPGGIVASSYDPGTGVLTLTGVATLDDYEAALQQVLYRNISDNPATDDRLIEMVVSDGVNTSNVADAVIRVVAVNDAPVIQIDTVVPYLENAAPIALSPLAILTDADDTELNDVTVRITGGTISGDGDTLTVGGSTSGTINGITFLWDPIDHALVLTGASLVANYQDLLRTVEYHSTSDNPTDFNANSTRTLTWSVSGGTAVTTETTTLDIVAVNDAPQVTVAAAASYTENGAPVVLSPASTVIDVDDINLVAGEVRIVSGEVDGDLLTVNGLQSGTFSGIDFSYNAALHSLTFTHPTDVADYQTFLEAIAFSSTSDNPADSGLSPTRTLSWFVFDGDALSDVRTTVVSITAVNDAPVNTVPGAQTVNEDTALPIAGVSAADVDSTTLTTTLTVLSGTLHVTAGSGISNNDTGTVTVTGTAAEINAALAGLSYTGNLNFNGSDTLTVSTNDGTLTDTDTISLTVNPVNDAPVAQDGSDSGNEDTPISGTLVATDVDSPSLTYSLGTQAAHGNVVVNPNASYTYTPNLDFNGTDSFTFTANDGTATSNTATISLTVDPVNDPPVNTVPGAQTVNEDTALPIAGLSIADVDSQALTTTLAVLNGTLHVTAGTGVSNNDTGTVTVTGTQAEINTALAGLSYTGNLDFNGPDTLTVSTSDGAFTDTDTVAITVNPVNDAPVAQDGSNSGNEDTTISGTLVATDVDSANLTYSRGTQAAHGTVVVDSTGTYSYTPDPDFNGPDSFTFTASDGSAASNTATISLTVNPVNDAPVAQDGSNSGNEDTPISGSLVATDVDSPGLTYSLGAQATHGNVVVNPDGSYTYTPNLDFNGADSFTFAASDGTAGSNIATISLTVDSVNDPPVNTVPVAQTVNEDTVLPIAGFSVADVDSPNLTTTLTVVNGLLAVVPEIGVTITGNLANTVTISGPAADVNAALAGVNYIGNPGFDGADTLTIVTSDGVLTDTDTVAITVNPVNNAPNLDLDADNSSGAPGRGFVTTFTENGPAITLVDTDIVLTDDDANLTSARFLLINPQAGDSLVVNGVLPAGITATVTANELTLTGTVPLADYQTALQQIAFNNSSDAPDTSDRLILVTVDDGAATSEAFALVNVTAVNDAPVAQDGSNSGNEDTTISGTLVATDVDSPSLTYALGAQAANGTAVINPDGSYTYTPNPDFNGPDSFTFTANDGTAGSNTATISLTINPVSEAPGIDGVASSTAFTEDDAPTTLSSALTLTGPDTFTSATVTITAGLLAGDMLAATIAGTSITADYDGSTGILTLTGADTLAHYQQVLAGVSYQSTSDNPTDFDADPTRTVSWIVSDGSTSSAAQTTAIAVNGVNDPPVASNTRASLDYAEGDPATILSPGVTTADPDNLELASATIGITGGLFAGDVLTADTGGTSIVAAYDPATGVLTLSGTDILAHYDQVLATVSYQSTSDNPTNFGADPTRIVSGVVNDGVANSPTRSTTIAIFAVNDAPVAQDGSNSGNEDSPISGTLVATDVDGPSLSYSLGAQAANGVVVVNADGSYTYTPNAGFNGTDSFTFTANDGTADSNIAMISVVIDPNSNSTDFNGDGFGDIFWQVDGGQLAIWEMSGFQISFADYTRLSTSAVGLPGPDWHVIDTADVNGDGKTDILWRTDAGKLAVWEMDGNHIIGADYLRIGSTITDAPGSDWHALGSIDADGDGKGDILWRTDSGALAIWELDGYQIKFADYLHSGSTTVGVPAPDWHIVGAGDFDGDGKGDLLWRTDTGALAIWELNGNQIKSADYLKSGAAVVGAPGADWHVVDVADFDGDGKADILWRTGAPTALAGSQAGAGTMEPGGGQIAIWEMNGNQIKAADYTRLGPTAVGAPGADWHILGADDHNGDGKADLLWRTDGGALAEWQMDGTHITASDYTRIGATATGAPGPDWHVYEHHWDLA